MLLTHVERTFRNTRERTRNRRRRRRRDRTRKKERRTFLSDRFPPPPRPRGQESRSVIPIMPQKRSRMVGNMGVRFCCRCSRSQSATARYLRTIQNERFSSGCEETSVRNREICEERCALVLKERGWWKQITKG